MIQTEARQRYLRIGLEYLGLVVGAAIAILGLYWSYDLIRSGSVGSVVGGSILGTADLVAMVSTFVYGTRAREQD